MTIDEINEEVIARLINEDWSPGAFGRKVREVRLWAIKEYRTAGIDNDFDARALFELAKARQYLHRLKND